MKTIYNHDEYKKKTMWIDTCGSQTHTKIYTNKPGTMKFNIFKMQINDYLIKINN